MSYQAPPPQLDPRFLEGLRLFDEGHYYRCHDVLEDLWFDEVGPVRRVLQALIQIAVGLYHRENGNRRGAARLFERAAEKVGPVPDRLLGLDLRDLEARSRALARETEAGSAGEPAFDPALVPRFHERRQQARAEAHAAGVSLELPDHRRDERPPEPGLREP